MHLRSPGDESSDDDISLGVMDDAFDQDWEQQSIDSDDSDVTAFDTQEARKTLDDYELPDESGSSARVRPCKALSLQNKTSRSKAKSTKPKALVTARTTRASSRK